MLKTTATDLKARLGKYMKAVKRGTHVVVTDRDQPVAKLVPFNNESASSALALTQARDPTAPPFGELEVRPLPQRRNRKTNSTALIRADRDNR